METYMGDQVKLVKSVDIYNIEIKGGLAYIGQSGPLNRDSLQTRIENIRARRHEYATEDAWSKNLEVSIGALAALDASTASNSVA